MANVGEKCCVLCGKAHGSSHLIEGWFATGIFRRKNSDTAHRLICPECVDRIMSKEVEKSI